MRFCLLFVQFFPFHPSSLLYETVVYKIHFTHSAVSAIISAIFLVVPLALKYATNFFPISIPPSQCQKCVRYFSLIPYTSIIFLNLVLCLMPITNIFLCLKSIDFFYKSFHCQGIWYIPSPCNDCTCCYFRIKPSLNQQIRPPILRGTFN